MLIFGMPLPPPAILIRVIGVSIIDDCFCDVVDCLAGLAVSVISKDGKYVVALCGAAYS